MLQVSHLTGFNALDSLPAASRIVNGWAVNAANAVTYNFNMDLTSVPADPTRRIIVISAGGTTTAGAGSATCTFAGAGMAKLAEATSPVGGAYTASIFRIAEAAGKGVKVVGLTFNTNQVRAGVAAYAIYNTQDILVDAKTAIGANPSVLLAGQAGGADIAVSAANVSGAFTWTGLTEDFEVLMESGNSPFSGASGLRASTGNLAIQRTATSSTFDVLAAVSLR